MKLTTTCHGCGMAQVTIDPTELVYHAAPDQEHRSGWYLLCRNCGAGEPLAAHAVPSSWRAQIAAQRAERAGRPGTYGRADMVALSLKHQGRS